MSIYLSLSMYYNPSIINDVLLTVVYFRVYEVVVVYKVIVSFLILIVYVCVVTFINDVC